MNEIEEALKWLESTIYNKNMQKNVVIREEEIKQI